ncbi:hypothetical protein [uncultured Tolumonas sp.]|uniref:hypothetical protein n=1 Tax=uncultured Tolumonas sp. TaxID=263765 RepID=UPI002A0A9098|nr:hypothetical protein [uncultured Tolumonas sp.]
MIKKSPLILSIISLSLTGCGAFINDRYNGEFMDGMRAYPQCEHKFPISENFGGLFFGVTPKTGLECIRKAKQKHEQYINSPEGVAAASAEKKKAQQATEELNFNKEQCTKAANSVANQLVFSVADVAYTNKLSDEIINCRAVFKTGVYPAVYNISLNTTTGQYNYTLLN